MMKLGVVLVAAFLASASVAIAHNTKVSWSAAKAEVIVTNDATIPIPAAQKAEVEAGLRAKLAQFQALQLTAQQERGDWLAAGIYNNYVIRFRDVLAKVKAGLAIDTADCVGTGKAVKKNRFKHFRCSVTSVVLEVPTADVTAAEPGQSPTVVDGLPLVVGPLKAVLSVHITGKSSISFKTIG
jgi:hypothetical protein